MKRVYVTCKNCGDRHKLADSTHYRPWGRLCPPCDSRATVVTDEDDRAIRVSISPKVPT